MTAKRRTMLGANKHPTLVPKYKISVQDQSIHGKVYRRTRGKTPVSQMSRSEIKTGDVKSDDSFECDVCHMTLASKSVLKRHRAYYGELKYPCKICSRKFSDPRQVQLHISYAHAKGKPAKRRSPRCPVCDQSIICTKLLRPHLYHYHSEWVAKNPDIFDSPFKITQTEINEKNAEIAKSGTTKNSHETAFFEGSRDVSFSSTGINTPSESAKSPEAHRTRPVSSSLSKRDISGRSFVEMNGNLIAFEPVLNNIKFEVADSDMEDSCENDPLLASTNEIDIEETLKELYSCKECYVPLTRLRLPANMKQLKNFSEVEEPKNSSMSTNNLFVRPEETVNSTTVEKKLTVNAQKMKNSSEKLKTIDEEREISEQTEALLSDITYIDENLIKTEPGIDADVTAEENFEKLETQSSSSFRASASPSKSISNQPIKSRTMIASKICDKRFTNKRAMMRHFRSRHMVCSNDITYCVCGKEMPGRAAREKHFYQYCSEIVTADPSLETFVSCQPLETKWECIRCGEKFWLKNCFLEHTQRCKFIKNTESERRDLTLKIQQRYKRLPRNPAQYVCTDCNSGFNTAEGLSQHIKKYSNTKRHPCPICNTVFNERRLLTAHVQSTHDSNRRNSYNMFCEICNQGFTKNLYKRIHIMHSHSVDLWENTGNKFVSDTKPSLSQIVKTEIPRLVCSSLNHNFMPSDNKCRICDLEFVSRKRFIDHMIYHKADEIIYCNICCKEFKGQYMAHRHNKTFHYSEDMQKAYTHRCVICQDSFMYKAHLKSHIAHVHGYKPANGTSETAFNPNTRKIFECKVCEISFPTSDLLTTHELTYANGGDFACNQCPKKCRTAAILLDHISLNHSNKVLTDAIKCSRCNEKLLTRTDWVSHVKHFHNSEPNEPSEFCFENNVSSSEEFGKVEIELIPTNDSISSGMSWINFGRSNVRSNDGSAIHFKTFRIKASSSTVNSKNNEADDSSEKIWANCTTCGLACSGPAELAQHMALYSNTGHYNCNICSRKFAWQRYYEMHKMKHFRYEPNNVYVCSTCDEVFETMAAMKMHEAHLHQVCASLNIKNGLPVAKPMENAIELKLQPTDDKQLLQTDIFGTGLKFVYQCPTCKNNFSTLDILNAHIAAVHKPNNGDQKDSAIGDDDVEPVMCTVCQTFFINKNILRRHNNNFHSLESEAEVSRKVNQPGAAGNRFYVLAGMEILPEAVDVLEKNFEQCNKMLGLTECIYRYGPLYKCDICSIAFANKDSLHAHQSEIHTVSPNVPIYNQKSYNARRSWKCNSCTMSFVTKYSLNVHRSRVHASIKSLTVMKILPGGIRLQNATPKGASKKIILLSPSFASRAEKNFAEVKSIAEPLKKTILPAFTTSILKPGKSENEDQNKHYTCKVCDLIFVNKNLLSVHEVNGECLRGPFRSTVNDKPSRKKIRIMKKVERIENNRPLDVNDAIVLVSERIQPNSKISNTTNELLNTPISEDGNNKKLKTSLETICPTSSPPQTEMINLSSGTMEKMQMRRYGNVVNNLIDQTGCKRKSGNAVLGESAVKHVNDRVFDPDAYWELCRQHNLVSEVM